MALIEQGIENRIEFDATPTKYTRYTHCTNSLVSCPVGKFFENPSGNISKKLGLQSNFHTFAEEFARGARQPMKSL